MAKNANTNDNNIRMHENERTSERIHDHLRENAPFKNVYDSINTRPERTDLGMYHDF